MHKTCTGFCVFRALSWVSHVTSRLQPSDLIHAGIWIRWGLLQAPQRVASLPVHFFAAERNFHVLNVWLLTEPIASYYGRYVKQFGELSSDSTFHDESTLKSNPFLVQIRIVVAFWFYCVNHEPLWSPKADWSSLAVNILVKTLWKAIVHSSNLGEQLVAAV